MKYSNDKSVVFNSEDHTYINKGKKLTSVTTFISQFKNEFDSDFFSKKIALRDGKTQEQVLSEWKEKAHKSCEIGTAIHKIFEDYVNGKYSILNDKLIFDFTELQPEYVLEFTAKSFFAIKFIEKFFITKRLIPIYTEYIVYDENLAGQIDLICKDKNENFYILDFKTNEKIEKYSYNKTMKGVFNFLNDSSYYHYCLQLSIYKNMLKEKIKGLYLVHIKIDSFEFVECEDVFENYKISYKDLF